VKGLAACAAVKVELPSGRTTLTAATGEYPEESERAVVTPPRRSEIGAVFLFDYFWGQNEKPPSAFFCRRRPREQPSGARKRNLTLFELCTRRFSERGYIIYLFF
jgi:hypothetical protein